MEGLFRQIGIYNPRARNTPGRQGPGDVLPRGQGRARSCEEGINEAGGMSSWIAAATSRTATNNRIMMPFYVYYSMFGFQRIGDLAWAAGDMRRAASCSAAPPAAPR